MNLGLTLAILTCLVCLTVAQYNPIPVLPDLTLPIPSLVGKVILVTGVSSNKSIGRATALEFASRGAIVIGCARTDKEDVINLAELENVGIRYYECDVRSEESIQRLARKIGRRYGKLDILASIAGVNHYDYISDIRRSVYKEMMLTNQYGFLNLFSEFQHLLNNSATPTIVSVVSAVQSYPIPFMGGYKSTKDGLESLLEGLYWENLYTNFRFVSIHPTSANTNVGIHSLRSTPTKCVDKVNYLYNATLTTLANSQSASNVAMNILAGIAASAPGKYIKYMSADITNPLSPSYYTSVPALGGIYLNNNVTTSITTLQNLVFYPRRADPATCDMFPSP